MKCSCGKKTPPDLASCIECTAKASGKRKWTTAEDEVIERYFGATTPEVIQRCIYTATRSARSVAAVAVRAGKMGLDHRTNQDGITLMDACRECGVAYWHLGALQRQGIIKPWGKGKVRLISLEELDVIRQAYPEVKHPAMTKTQAMKRLGYSETHITRLLKAGAIRGTRRGERWFVDASHVAELVKEMKRTGETRRDWGALPLLEAERARTREYARGRRKETRRIARETNWYTQQDAGRVLGVGSKGMRRMLEQGAVRGKRENGLWLAERGHIDQLAQVQGEEAS